MSLLCLPLVFGIEMCFLWERFLKVFGSGQSDVRSGTSMTARLFFFQPHSPRLQLKLIPVILAVDCVEGIKSVREYVRRILALLSQSVTIKASVAVD